jgi:hypothetical protein
MLEIPENEVTSSEVDARCLEAFGQAFGKMGHCYYIISAVQVPHRKVACRKGDATKSDLKLGANKTTCTCTETFHRTHRF